MVRTAGGSNAGARAARRASASWNIPVCSTARFPPHTPRAAVYLAHPAAERVRQRYIHPCISAPACYVVWSLPRHPWYNQGHLEIILQA